MIKILFLSKIKSEFLKHGVKKYEKFISKLPLKVVSGFKGNSKKEKDFVLSHISNRDFVVVCDERGKQLDSFEFARMIKTNPNIVFIIGGAYGVSESVKELGSTFFSMSRLTFSHELALLVLLEQLYRAETIIFNHPYHK